MRNVSITALLIYTDTGIAGSYMQAFPSLGVECEPALARVMDAALDTLPPDQRRCVELIVVGHMSYREAAIEMDWFLASGQPNKKRVWRHVKRGLRRLRAAVGSVDAPPADTVEA